MANRGNNTEHDALVGQYSHLATLPREKDALHALRRIASLVKPIMRARNWTVGTLAEFYPDQQNLLGKDTSFLYKYMLTAFTGINVNKGMKICLRLRYPGDQNQFLPMEQVVDTMLHELSHNVHGPHDAKFHALWDQLRKEYEGLVSKGYTGEGFLSEGHRLGGRGTVPRDEARRIARLAAEKRRTLSSGSGQKLGGRPIPIGTDIRRVIVDAIERRNTVLKGCGGGGNKDDKEIQALGDQATNNGFKTKAEEDEANDRAIAQALWELVQEDEKKKYGSDYIPPTPTDPTGNGGGEISPKKLKKVEESVEPPKAKAPPIRRPSDRPVSRLVAEHTSKKPKTIPSRGSSSSSMLQSVSPPVMASSEPLPSPRFVSGWTCIVCTLHNPVNFLACDACTSERPPEVTRQIAEAEKKYTATSRSISMKSNIWTCSRCSTEMEDKWWTCSTCGRMKDTS
jgi:hypothetical protein